MAVDHLDPTCLHAVAHAEHLMVGSPDVPGQSISRQFSALQIVNLFLPRVNCRRFASWYKDGEPADMSPTDSQVS